MPDMSHRARQRTIRLDRPGMTDAQVADAVAGAAAAARDHGTITTLAFREGPAAVIAPASFRLAVHAEPGQLGVIHADGTPCLHGVDEGEAASTGRCKNGRPIVGVMTYADGGEPGGQWFGVQL